MQEFTAPVDGVYKLEVWGAQGGNYNNSLGGKGGYSIGYKSLGASNNLYVCVGSKGSDHLGNTGGNGGYNGGGKGGNGCPELNYYYQGGSGGGGATHIAISDCGVLKNYKDYQQELLLVAGGGGGRAANVSKCGVGGGLNGGNAYSTNDVYTITGASQNTGYAFGQGQDGISKILRPNCGAEGNGGGGGGFYGGPASQETEEFSDCGGAGGSGYVGSVINGETIAGDQTFPSPSGGTEMGHSGDGYAIITWQQLP